MRKLFYAFVAAGFITSCASHPGRVCGGKGGGRVVESNSKTIHNPVV